VSQQSVKRALGRLVTNDVFRERFFTSSEAATWKAGLALSPIELEALPRLSPPLSSGSAPPPTSGHTFTVRAARRVAASASPQSIGHRWRERPRTGV
jgi:hypothetical protein